MEMVGRAAHLLGLVRTEKETVQLNSGKISILSSYLWSKDETHQSHMCMCLSAMRIFQSCDRASS